MQSRFVEIPNIEGAWPNERPFRLTDGHRYTTGHVIQPLMDHRRKNGFTSNGFCTESQARSMGRRPRPGQLDNSAEVWFKVHRGDEPARFYNEDQLW